MSDLDSDVRATVDEIVMLREALLTRHSSHLHGVQEALEKLRLRATALLTSPDRDAHEAIEVELYALVESGPEIREAFRAVRDAEAADVLRRTIEDLERLGQQRALAQHELEALRAARSFYDDVSRGAKAT
jgi:rubrerythrin